MSTPTPNDPNSFTRLFEEMADMLQTALELAEAKFDNDLPKELEDMLAKLENDVEVFCQLNATLIEEAKMRGENAATLEHLSKQEKRILERTKKLVADAEKKHKEFAAIKFDPSLLAKDRKKHLKRLNRKKV